MAEQVREVREVGGEFLRKDMEPPVRHFADPTCVDEEIDRMELLDTFGRPLTRNKPNKVMGEEDLNGKLDYVKKLADEDLEKIMRKVAEFEEGNVVSTLPKVC